MGTEKYNLNHFRMRGIIVNRTNIFIYLILVLLFLSDSSFASEITFVSNGHIWLINDDNTGLTQLSDSPRSSISSLKWSPNGKRLAYVSDLGLEMIDMESNTNVNLGQFYGTDYSWSPDGTAIVTTNRMPGDSQYDGVLYVIPVDNPGLNYQLTPSQDCMLPYWSHDGSMITFTSRNLPNPVLNGVYIIDPDGNNMIKLSKGWRSWGWTFDDSYLLISDKDTRTSMTDLLAMDLELNTTFFISDSFSYSKNISLSPIGNRVAFTVEHVYEVYGNSDASEEAMICDIGSEPIGFGWSPMYNPYEIWTVVPKWAPSGDRVAFQKTTPYRHSIFIGELDGSSFELIEHNGGIKWSPDGKTILSGSYVIDLATSNIQQINAPSSVIEAIWRPLNTKYLQVKDIQNNSMNNINMYLIRVNNDAPLFTPDTLGIVKTDADGKIQLTPVQ